MKVASPYFFLRLITLLVGCFVIFSLWYLGYSYFYAKPLPTIVTGSRQLSESGESVSVALTGSGFGKGLNALLVPNVDNIQAIAATLPLAGHFNDSVLFEKFLYLATNGQGLYFVDVSNPKRPRLGGEYLVGQAVTSLLVIDDVLVAGCRKGGISFFNIMDSGQLKKISSIEFSHPVVNFYHSQNLLFVAMGQNGLIGVDVRDFSSPFIAATELNEFVLNVGVVGKHLVVFNGKSPSISTYAFDSKGHISLTDQLIGTERIVSSAFDKDGFFTVSRRGLSRFSVGKDGHLRSMFERPELNTVEKIFSGSSGLYLYKNFSALAYYDVDTFAVTPNYFLSEKILALEEIDNYLLVAGKNKGLTVYDRNAFTSSHNAQLYEMPHTVTDLLVDQHNLYVAVGMRGGYYGNINNPHLQLQALTELPVTSFASAEGRLFVAHGNDGIEVFDTADSDPVRLTQWPEVAAIHLAVWNNFVISSQGFYGIECIDFNNINEPVITDRIPDLHALALSFERNILYVATKNKGLVMFSVSEQGTLSLLGDVMLPFPMNKFSVATDIQVQNGYAYIANGRSGLLVVDVHDPRHPVIVSSLGLTGGSKGIILKDHLALVINARVGIDLVNVEDVRKPVVVGKIPLPSLSRYAMLSNGVLYLTRTQGTVLALPLPKISTKMDVQRDKATIHFDEMPIAGHYDLNLSSDSELIVVKDAVVIKN